MKNYMPVILNILRGAAAMAICLSPILFAKMYTILGFATLDAMPASQNGYMALITITCVLFMIVSMAVLWGKQK